MANKSVMLKSCEGNVFYVDEIVALKSNTLKHVIEDTCVDIGIPLANVTGEVLALVIEYCEKQAESPKEESHLIVQEEELRNWDVKFLKVNQAMLLHLVFAADYLHIQSLLDLACEFVTKFMEGKTWSDIREGLNMENGFAHVEEAELRRRLTGVGCVFMDETN